MNVREFLPSIWFLVKFVGFFTVASLTYAIYVQMSMPKPDSMTHLVAEQTRVALDLIGWETDVIDNDNLATTRIVYKNKSILSIYEGCNGINIFIIFLSFIFAFGKINLRTAYFGVLGIFVIHLVNLLRITLLFFVSYGLSEYFYFVHKYLFTSVIYLITFVLWYFWVRYKMQKV